MSSSIRRSTPLSRAEALSLANALNAGNAGLSTEGSGDGTGSGFLAFMMIPAEERIGEWRFAGATGSLPQALSRIVDFAVEMGMSGVPREQMLQEWLEQEALEVWTDVSKAWSYDGLPLREIGDHRVLLFAEGQAPYDDFGLAVLEIDKLAGSPFEGRAPETTPPESWSQRGDGDDVILDDE